MNEIILQIIKPLDSKQTLNLSLRHNLHSKVSQTDPAFKAHKFLWSHNCELPWNYRIPANVSKILVHNANLSTDIVRCLKMLKIEPFVLFQITLISHTGFAFFHSPILISHFHFTLLAIWGPSRYKKNPGDDPGSPSPFLPFHSQSSAVSSMSKYLWVLSSQGPCPPPVSTAAVQQVSSSHGTPCFPSHPLSLHSAFSPHTVLFNM